MNQLGQYKDLAFFLWKYGNSDLVEQAKLDEIASEEWKKEKQSSRVSPEQMVADLKKMGPSFVKLGQLLSTRSDLLPTDYTEQLASLQDDVEPFPYEQVEQIIQDELGIRISKAFSSFEKYPIASASLGQVHLAKLRNGETIVVKVQRPGIRKRVHEELEILDKTSGFLEKNTSVGKRYQLHKLFLQFRQTLLRELNYLKEAEHIRRFRNNLAEFPAIIIPSTIQDYTSEKVLTMQYLKGKKITGISPLQKLEMNGEELADELFKAYLKQIVIDGFVHADPHPGNIHIMNDNKIALLDFGMVAHISPKLRDHYLKLLINIGKGNADEVVDRIIDMSEVRDDADEENFRSVVSALVLENLNVPAQSLQTGRMIIDMVRFAAENGFMLPVEISLIGKTLLNLDQAGRTLSPGFNPNEALRRNAIEITNRRLYQELTSLNIIPALLESKEILEKFPERLNKFLHNIAENKIRVKIDALDEEKLMSGFQKVANRITVGLILAALIIGSSLLMQVETNFTLFGYPGLAMIFFLLAVAGASFLSFRIFLSDRNR